MAGQVNKVKKKIWVLLLLLMTMLCSCGREKKEETSGLELRQIAGFDTMGDLYNFWLDCDSKGTIGSTALNHDKTYISQGEGSLKWEMEGVTSITWNGESYDTGSPMCANYKICNNTEEEFTDMRNVRYISIDCYNANEFEITVGSCIVSYIGDTYFSFDDAAITIPPGEWGTLRVSLNRYDTERYSLVTHIPFTVNYAFKVAEEKTELVDMGELYYPKATVYLDNIYAVQDNGAEKEEKAFADENELLSFDTILDMQYASTYMANGELSWNERNMKIGTGVSAEYNTDPTYTNGRNGSLMLRIDSMNNTCNNWIRQYMYDSAYEELWLGVEFKGFLDQVDFLPLATGKARIAIDVYNGFGYDKEVYFGCDDVVNGHNYFHRETEEYASENEMPLSTVYKLEQGKWTTIYFEENEELDLSQGLARIRLATSRTDVFDTGCLYMNNLRLVKEGEE